MAFALVVAGALIATLAEVQGQIFAAQNLSIPMPQTDVIQLIFKSASLVYLIIVFFVVVTIAIGYTVMKNLSLRKMIREIVKDQENKSL
jgi:uncharacterized membrane protein